MMDMKTPALRTSDHPGPCCCEECSGQCCELECLVQPRFYCGQLLTDQDLTALLDWMKAKSGLARYRHGWGVVCGLTVQCEMEPSGETTLKVTPGYAIDCCGHDIIVCSDAMIDLASCCKPKPDPCLDPAPGSERKPEDTSTVRFGPWELPTSEVQAVDVLIRYAESPTDPRPGLARGGCGGTVGCDYTRTEEGYKLDCRPADACAVATTAAGERYQAYRRGLGRLLDELAGMQAIGDDRLKLDRLIEWLARNPTQSFCFVREWLCGLRNQPDKELPGGWFDEAMFWIVQDARNHRLVCDCSGCGPDTAVPLGRVWLWRRTDHRGKDRCTPIYSTGYPPFRRTVSGDCWPTAEDRIGLAPYIWQLTDFACVELRKSAIHALFRELQPLDLGGLRALLDKELIDLSCADLDDPRPLVAYVRTDHCGQQRIVCFAREGMREEEGVAAPTDATPAPAPDAAPTDATPAPAPGATGRGRTRGRGR